MKYDYNPFDKDFEDVATGDLVVLSSVAEGWYVEYKREVPNASSIAKSVTAFANTYGGWLFYGIAEKSKEDPVAHSLPGILNEDADACLQRFRQAVANHAQPAPFFRVKALFGPLEEFGLLEGRCVIVAYVPWGPEAPYIHKDGRIYRRVGDGSEPRPENDRFILDKLWGRASEITQKYADWINRDLEVSQGEDNAAFVRIFLVADFWGDHGSLSPISLKRIREIMSDTNGDYTIPFDNVYQTSDGYVSRQTTNNDPEKLGLTWKLSRGFESEIVIPVSKFRYDSLGELASWLVGYEHASRFLEICRRQNYLQPTVIDLNIILHVLLGVARIQVALAKEFGWTGSIYAKIEISGVWRTVPFFDTPHVLDEYDIHGIALGQNDKVILHPGKGQRSFIELNGVNANSDESNQRIMMAIQLFLNIARALGVSALKNPDGDGTDAPDSILSFMEAGLRAIEVQKNRAKLS